MPRADRAARARRLDDEFKTAVRIESACVEKQSACLTECDPEHGPSGASDWEGSVLPSFTACTSGKIGQVRRALAGDTESLAHSATLASADACHDSRDSEFCTATHSAPRQGFAVGKLRLPASVLPDGAGTGQSSPGMDGQRAYWGLTNTWPLRGSLGGTAN